ncbi:hypothetical protein PHSY_007085 [Pseudozyma hubeiensis SY62]|uniref:Elongator complex protein 4 n=1 Tax=Pseudozyma hubeiensis (strain SY62) TaxID=1305764 RepID=R9PDM2_PSEHS|nr:hypothetical protein PHSY_007085 [Pseudozyma hubeiensis SY62]GAC99483.1 hypothetical protein PHSY_007085 [Pseudozyma hubeiensis SY62]
MSSFKRRVNPASGSTASLPLPAGVKPSSFSSPVPLISTGVPALDDLLSGGGLSSSSNLLLIPATGTAAQSAAQIGASSSTTAASAETDHAARAAAEPYVELLLGYSVAQGIAADHVGVVIAEDAKGLVNGLMARAGDLDEQLLKRIGASSASARVGQEEDAVGPSESLNTVTDDDEAEGPDASSPGSTEGNTEGKASAAQREREMKIAWRYHSMKQFNTTVNEPGSSSSSSEPTPFCQTFDLSRRIDTRIVQHAVEQKKLELVDIPTVAANLSSSRGINSYEVAFKHIEASAQRCRQQVQAASSTTAPPVLRIAIRALGSPAWTVARGQSQETEIIRFLHRLKRLLRSLSFPDTSLASTSQSRIPIPSMAVISISSFLLSTSTSPTNLPHRMVHSVDSAVSMSAFASSPSLRSAFTAYTGALKVLKTPAVGTLTNPSIRSSVLRGMGTGAGAGAGGKSTAGGGEGGAGGGENNLAFKVRRKRLVIETLHLDVEGGVSERRTKPPKNGEVVEKGGRGATASQSEGSTVATEDKKPQKTIAGATGGSSFVRRQPSASDPPTATGSTSGPAATTPKKFGGLSSLRQRGLAAAAAATGAQTGQPGPTQKEYSVEIDSQAQHHGHSHSHKPKTAGPAINRAANARAEDLEF